MESDQITSFAFFIPSANLSESPTEGAALLRIDDVQGRQVLVQGPEAVTLKVLLSSLGIKDLSAGWSPGTVQDAGSLPAFSNSTAPMPKSDLPPKGAE